MSDTQTSASVKRVTEAKTIVKQGVLGHPMKYLDENNTRQMMGRVLGYATGVSSSTVDDQETGEQKTLRSLTGSFKAIPTDVSRPIVTSAKLGLPVHIMQPFVEAMIEGKKDGIILQIAFDIGCEVAKNAAGYSWFGVSLTDADDDPLSRLEADIAKGGVKMLAGKSEPEGSEAQKGDLILEPEVRKGKGGKK